MATKTISLRMEAYERLRRVKREDESFSDAVMRATWEDEPVTGGELATLLRERGPLYTREELGSIEAIKTERAGDRDKWAAG